MDKENLIKQIMYEAEKDGEPLTREEAEEVAEMEIKAKSIKNYVSDVDKKTKAKKERKIDNEKLILLKILAAGLEKNKIQVKFENEVKIHFEYNNSKYSITLTKHRPLKNI